MKTQPLNNQICEEQQNFSSVSAFSLARQLFTKAFHVHLVGRTGQSVYTSLHHLQKNRRHFIGVVMVVLAPLTGSLYLLFDSTPPPINEVMIRLQEWYFLTWYYFLKALSPYLVMLFGSLGGFLLFPTKYKISYVAAVVPTSYALLIIIHYSFFVTCDADFNNHSWAAVVSALTISIGLVLSCDYLVYREHHPIAGAVRRILGMIKVPGISPEQKLEILDGLADEYLDLNARV